MNEPSFSREEFRAFLETRPGASFTTGDACACPIACWVRDELTDTEADVATGAIHTHVPYVKVYPDKIVIGGRVVGMPDWMRKFVAKFDTDLTVGFIPPRRSGLATLKILERME